MDQLIKYKEWLTEAQKKTDCQSSSCRWTSCNKTNQNTTRRLFRHFFSIDWSPTFLNARTGTGLQVDSQRSRRSIPVYVPKPAPVKSKKDGGLVIPADYRSPPFIGTWEQYGKGKKKKGHGLLLGKNSPFKNIPLTGAIL